LELDKICVLKIELEKLLTAKMKAQINIETNMKKLKN